MRAITFRRQAMPWGMMSCYHRHRLTTAPVTLFLVQDGRAVALPYRPEWFDYGTSGIAPMAGLDYAGFALHDEKGEWASFQGASYFRCTGPLRQYGLSARGLAIDTGFDDIKEEFPDFVQMYVENKGNGHWVIFCLLDGPSVCGAYRFAMARDAPWEVEAVLFMRNGVRRLGIAPLTSMYWYGENDPERCHDWRPEVHDSDGLLVAQADPDTRLWRPLTNPPGPKIHNENHGMAMRGGFGLMQRDGLADHYLSPEARYQLRPSLWVEPLQDWKQGKVQLVILPTSDEYHDNVVAFWMPQGRLHQGDRLHLRYRLWWTRAPWHGMGPAGFVAATRWGWVKPDVLRMAIDWAGLPQTVSQGLLAHIEGIPASQVILRHLPELGLWQVLFDLSRKDLTEQGRVRAFLCQEGITLSETWEYPLSDLLTHCRPC
jgi:glucans biosynthesis protein